MIVISAGMQKSGSAYLYNIINDLMIEGGMSDSRLIREKYELDDILENYNNYFDEPTKIKLIKLWIVSLRENPYVVKTHAGVSRFMSILTRLGLIKIIYIYRDPRDVILSAADHGKKILNKGENHSFVNMINYEDGLKALKDYMTVWYRYHLHTRTLKIRYEDLMTDPKAIVNRILIHLGIEVKEETQDEILRKYDRNTDLSSIQGLHFNKAKIFRYKSEMPAEHIAMINEEFGEEIKLMGYEI